MKKEDKAARVSMGIALSVIVLSIFLIYLAGGYLMKEMIIFIAGGVLGLFAGGILFLIFLERKKCRRKFWKI